MGVVVNQLGAQVILINQSQPVTTVVQSTPQVVQVAHVGNVVETSRVLGPPPRGLAALGWRFFQDSAYVTQGLYCPAMVRTQIPDNGMGMLQQAAGVNSSGWLSAQSGRFFPDAVGDFFIYRLNYTATPTVNNKTALFDFDIGTPNRIWNKRIAFTTGAGISVPDSHEIMTSSSAAHKLNGGAFYITPDADMFISKISVLAVKTFSVDPLS